MRHNRAIFLDVDGVLNSDAWYDGFLSEGKRIPRPPIDRMAVDRLDQIVRATDSWIVLSTSWRGYPELPRWLVERGLSGPVVGCTPRLWNRQRGAEIAAWLNQQARTGVPIKQWCILDDGDDMGAMTPWLVQTTQQDGLQDEHVYRAVVMLLCGPE